MEVRITIAPGEIRNAVRQEIEGRVGALTSDSMVYDQVMGAIWEGMQMSGELPVDSEALEAGEGEHFSQHTSWTDKKNRVHNSTLYPRIGNTYVTTHARTSTLHVDPFERRPSEDIHYASRHEDQIMNAKDSALSDPWVLARIEEITTNKLNRK